MKNPLFIYANPDFDQRCFCGMSKLYQIFYRKFGYKLEIIDDNFLQTSMPEQDFPRIIAIAGGDGTIHRVINIIPEGNLDKYIFGIIPGGTANEFAKSLKLPSMIEEAAGIIGRQENIINIKPGVVNSEHKFVTGFLYGIACKILRETSQKVKSYFGQYAYQLPGLFSIMNYQEFVKKFSIDSTEFDTGYLLINSASLTSKGIFPNELRGEKKDLFSIVYLSSVLSVGDFLRLIVENQSGSNILSDPSVFYRQMNNLTLEFKGELSFMLDGEDYMLPSPIRFDHLEKTIKVIT